MASLELGTIELFQDLDPTQLKMVEEKITLRSYDKGVTVFLEGEETDGIYIIVSGHVKVYMLHTDGREKTLALLSCGDVLGEVTLFGSDLRSAAVETLENATFYVISKEDFKTLIFNIPELAMRVIEMLSLRLRQTNRQIQEIVFLNAPSRVISSLLHLSEKYGKPKDEGLEIPLRLTHAELAKLAGVSRETVTKVLNNLHERRLIQMTHKHIKILKRKELLSDIL